MSDDGYAAIFIWVDGTGVEKRRGGNWRWGLWASVGCKMQGLISWGVLFFPLLLLLPTRIRPKGKAERKGKPVFGRLWC